MYGSWDMVRGGRTDRRTDRKSDIQRWVPHLKIILSKLENCDWPKIGKILLNDSLKELIKILNHDSIWLMTVSVCVRRTQLDTTGFEVKFRACSNPTGGVFEICDDKNLWKMFRLEITFNAFHLLSIPQKHFIIIIFLRWRTLKEFWVHTW